MRVNKGNYKTKIDWETIPNLYDRMRDLYEIQKMSINQVARELNISANGVRKKLVELGFRIRTKEESFALKMEEMYGVRD